MKKFFLVLIITATWLLPICLTAQDSWTKKADFGGIGRTGAIGFAIGSKGYIVTGEKYNNGSYICNRDLWEYDPATGIWSQKADFGGAGRFAAVGFSIGTKGYVGWGLMGPFSYADDFWEYDPATNAWTQKADLGSSGSREGGVGFSIGIKGYMGTGCNHKISYGARLKDFWEYDPAADSWTRKADFGGSSRAAAVGFSIGSKGFVGTGFSSVYLKDFWEFDPASNTWIQKADFGGTARQVATGFSIGNYGYIGTGFCVDAPSGRCKDFWEYSVLTDSWTQKPDFGGMATSEATGFSIGTKGYIGCGNINGQHTTDFWEYDPGCGKESTNIDEHLNDEGWMKYTLYPNPNYGQFTIKVKTNTLEVFNIDIYNMMGSRVGHIESVSVNGLLAIPEDLHEPASGMYTIVFRNRDKSDDEVVSKFVVAK